MTKTELNTLLDGVKSNFGLSGHLMQTDHPYDIGWGSSGWFTMPSFSRPIHADGSYALYFLNLLKIKKVNENGKAFTSKDSIQTGTGWQALRYSQFLTKTAEGYMLTPTGRRYINQVEAIKELFDKEKEYEMEVENA